MTLQKTTNQKRAILIDLIQPKMSAVQSFERLEELEHLVNTYGGIVVVKKYQKRFAPHPRTFIGPGKVQELLEDGEGLGINLLVINDILKSRQIYTISEQLRPAGIQVWDRIDLILKIFAKHASTTEARLEIELASIKHMGPRIIGMGMELSQQGGGIGTVGLGETNTEIMRRHLRAREQKIKEKLEKCVKARALHQANRRRRDFRTVAIVGYTNAGKTSLLNALTRRKEYVADELFATLDTRVGKLYLPEKKSVVLLSDTIGFIKNLPPELIKAFSSTLSEAVNADLLLQVVDGSDKNAEQQMAVVDDILNKLGVLSTPRIVVFNKKDAAGKERQRTLGESLPENLSFLWVSTLTREGLDDLIKML